MKWRTPFLLIWILFSAESRAVPGHVRYRVRRGEILSQIIQKYVEGRIYGPQGRLRCIYQMNPELNDQGILNPGNFINLPVDSLVPLPTERRSTKKSRWSAKIDFSDCREYQKNRLPAADEKAYLEQHEAPTVDIPPLEVSFPFPQEPPPQPVAEEAAPVEILPPPPTEKPAPPQQATAVVVEKNLWVPTNDFNLGVMATYGFASLRGFDATSNTRATLRGQLSPGIELQLTPNIYQSFRPAIFLGLEEFRVNTSDNRIFAGTKQITARLGVDLRYQVFSRLGVRARVGPSEEIFFHAPDRWRIAVHKFPMLKLEVGADFLLAQLPRNWGLQVEASVWRLVERNSPYYMLRAGQGRGWGLSLLKLGDTSTKELGFYMREQSQPTSLFGIKRSEYGIKIRYDFGAF